MGGRRRTRHLVAALALGQFVQVPAAGRGRRLRGGCRHLLGLTSGTVWAVWLGHAAPAAVAVGLTATIVGIALVQQAYRDGGLGAPLATLTLVDPLSAGALGVLLLGETST